MCGLAWLPAALLAARVVQGVGAAIMTPTGRSIVATIFTDGSEWNKTLGVWGWLGGIGATAAGLIGGPLVDGPGWEWILFINIPLGLAALVTATLAGVAEHESGLASGLSNTALQIGGALGVAIVTTVAVSRSDDYLAANLGANPLVVVNDGVQSAFLALVVPAGIGLALALLLLGRPRKARQEQLEPAPGTNFGC
jgi:MFS family permease